MRSPGRTRIAPTPSGFLHLGNAVNMRVIALVAERDGLDIALRIDDLDADRARPEYVADVFATLDWLGIAPGIGPSSPDDLRDSWSQRHRMGEYRRVAGDLLAGGHAFVCRCSRTEWADWTAPGCPGDCRDLELAEGRTLLRLSDDSGAGTVLWRREGIPAYHLASIVDDDLLGVTHVVRGADLAPSTDVQRRISRLITGSRFADAPVHHHALLVDEQGVKLSKSTLARGAALERSAAMRAEVEHLAQALAADADWVTGH